MKRFLSIVTLFILTLAAFQSVQADIVTPILNMRTVASDYEFDNVSDYVFAVNFQNQNSGSVTVNGITFTNVAFANVNTNTYTSDNIILTYTKTTGTMNNHGGNGKNSGTGNIASVMSGMVYNGDQTPGGTATTTLTGLTPGQDYTFTVYGRVWDGVSNKRYHTFTFQSGGAAAENDYFFKSNNPYYYETSFALSEDNPAGVEVPDQGVPASYWEGLDNSKPYVMEYTFTAPADGTFTMVDTGSNQNESWHLYGVSLRKPTIVTNGGFEYDTFYGSAHQHGYVEKYHAISGWEHESNASIGLAPEWGNIERTTQRCGDFIKAGQLAYLPEGSTQALFIQTAGSLSQEITLEPNTEYVLSYYTSSRTDYKNPYYQVSVDGQMVYDAPLRVNQFDRNIFTYNAIPFTSSQWADSPYTTNLTFNGVEYSDANSATDRTLLLDNVQIVKASEYVAPVIEGSKHDPTVNGWQANKWNSETTAYLSGSATDYTHAISLGETPDTTRYMTLSNYESLEFHGVQAAGNANASSPSQQYLTGGVSVVGNGNHDGGFGYADRYRDDNSRELARWTTCSMDRITLNGLEPGATYETMVYFRSYGASTRTGYMIVNGVTSPLINMVDMAAQEGGGLLVSYTGKADDYGVINIQFDNRNTDTFHLSAVANRYVSPAETAYNIPLQMRLNRNDGSDIVGSTPEVALGQFASKTLVERGFNQLSTFGQYDAKMDYNNGAAIDYKFTGTRATASADQIEGTNYGASKITLSADLMPGTLTTEGKYDLARGVGLGFFDSYYGGVGPEVGVGFAGLVLDPNGNLFYIDRASGENDGNTQLVAWGTDKANGGGAWKADAWTNVAMDLELFDDGLKAKITGINVVGSSADYSELVGKVFNTTDLIGFTSSASTTGKNAYVDNVQLIVREAATPATWNQQFEQYKADFIEAAGEDLAMATSFRGENGTVIPGTAMDIADTNPNNTWIRRGMGTGSWNLNGSRNGNPQFTLIDNQAKGSANAGLAAQWDSTGVLSMKLSVDLQMNSLIGSDYNQSARGLGMGFFDADYGTGNEEVAHGFSGIAVNPAGELYFYESTPAGYTMSTPIAFGGSFDKNEWYTLTMNLDFFQENGSLMAKLMGISLSGSDADYDSLIGTIFATTDLLGLLSSSATSWDNFGIFDNYTMSLIRGDIPGPGPGPGGEGVPEPSTWALILIGFAGLMYWRKRGKN